MASIVTDLDLRIAASPRISDDGSTIVSGTNPVGGSPSAFRWTFAEGLVPLEPVSGASVPVGSIARSVSANAEVIVGESEFAIEPCVELDCETETRAFIWTEAHATRDLARELERRGVDLAGSQLTSAMDVSADGTVIGGIGVNPGGELEAWRSVVPEPSLARAARSQCSAC